MDDIVASMHIRLEEAHVKGVAEYMKKLQANANNKDNFEDVQLEGMAALMFSKEGLDVTMRDSPDLALELKKERFYAEVKHFREKEQDRIDTAEMSKPCDLLVPYGDTFPLEGKHAWEQVYNVAKDKIAQYKEHAPNILVVESSSDCIDDTIMGDAIDVINKDVRSGTCPGFAKLNGILLIPVDWYNISQQRRVHFRPTSNHAVSLSHELFSLIGDIRLG